MEFEVNSRIEKFQLSHSYRHGVEAVFASQRNRPAQLKVGLLDENILELNFDSEEPVIGLYGFQSESDSKINKLGFITLDTKCLFSEHRNSDEEEEEWDFHDGERIPITNHEKNE